MRIEPLPVAPVRLPYRLDLTFDQLVALGVLSHRHELSLRGGRGMTFYDRLPADLKAAVTEKAAKLNADEVVLPRGRQIRATEINVDWGEEP